ncbi:C4-dicarboxylate ABC transporter [Collinsella tanakaei]|nr:C4-dicarboxylate ABC transporter [Collinsella tanakaei]
MSIAVLSLLFLVIVVALGYIKDLNVGILAIIASFALVLIGGLDMDMVLDGFPSSLFLNLLGTMYLFALLQENGTLNLLSQKLVSIVGKRTYLTPIVVYVISYVISAVGPGAISAQAIMIPFSVLLSVQMGIKPYMMSSMAILGTVGGTTSPVALTGIIVGGIIEDMSFPGIENTLSAMMLDISIMNVICALVIYILFKGYKLKPSESAVVGGAQKFNRDQKLCLVGMVVLVLCVLLLGFNVGIVGFCVAIALSLLNAVDISVGFKRVPWGVLILVGGMSILMDITFEVGGIELLTNLLQGFMNETIAPFVMTFTSGLTGWFSSGNGVVIPTFVPTAPALAESLGISPIEIIISIVAGATVGGLSPFDSGGSMIIGYYSQEVEVSAKEQQRMFLVFFGLAVLCVVLASLCGLVGIFSLGY